MKQTLTILAALLLTGAAGAGDVYVTRDAQGNPVYTDTPQSIPAEKVKIGSASSDPSAVEARYAEEMKKYAQDDKATPSPPRGRRTPRRSSSRRRRTGPSSARKRASATSPT